MKNLNLKKLKFRFGEKKIPIILNEQKWQIKFLSWYYVFKDCCVADEKYFSDLSQH